MTKMHLFIMISLMLLMAADAHGQSLLDCSGQPPIVDGKEDPAWAKAEAWVLQSQPAGKPVVMETTAKAMYDKHHLFFFVRCREVNLVEARQQERLGRRDAPIWNNDCVEFLLDVKNNDRSYYQFIVDIHGDIADFRRYDPDWKQDALAWNGYWQHAVGEYEDGWTVEVAIPWSILGDEVHDRKRIAMNISRARRIAPFERLVLMPDKESFHRLAAYKVFDNLALARPDLTLANLPEKLYLGSNPLTLTLANAGKAVQAGEVELTIRDQAGSIVSQSKTPVNVQPMKSAELTVPCVIDRPGEYQVGFSMLPAGGDRQHLASRPYVVRRVIELNDRQPLVSEGSRYAVYVRLFSSASAGTLAARVVDAAGKVMLEDRRPSQASPFFWSLDTRKLSPGDYRLVISYGKHESILPLTVTPRL